MKTEELDLLLQEILALREDYEKKDAIAKEAYHARKAKENEFLAALEASGKDKWNIPGVGTASLVNKLNVQVAKNIEDKRALWDYIVAKYGEDVAFDKFGMHSKTLQSFYNEERDSAEDSSLFSLPGVGEPTHEKEFRFRKA